jgi:inosine/xanthosine triphosphatase
MIHIAIGTTNVIKIEAVKETLKNYPLFDGAVFESYSISSEVSDQPLSLEEIIRGAKNRARNAFDNCKGCHYAFGIESGLFEALGTQTGYLEACICCIYDGISDHIGLSCGFEIPPTILHYVLNQQMDLSQACFHSGITSNAKLGSAEGLVGILTKGRINRKEYTKQCITTALIQLENHLLYRPDPLM